MSYYSIALTGKISAAHVGTTTQYLFVYRPSMADEFFELLSRCNTMHQVRAMTGDMPRDRLLDSDVQGVMSKQRGGNPIPINYVSITLSNGEGLLGESSNGCAEFKAALDDANHLNTKINKQNSELCREVKRLEGEVKHSKSDDEWHECMIEQGKNFKALLKQEDERTAELCREIIRLEGALVDMNKLNTQLSKNNGELCSEVSRLEGVVMDKCNEIEALLKQVNLISSKNMDLSKRNGALNGEVKRLGVLVMDGGKKRDAIYELYDEAANKLMLISSTLEK